MNTHLEKNNLGAREENVVPQPPTVNTSISLLNYQTTALQRFYHIDRIF
jgi:hypothetical protein